MTERELFKESIPYIAKIIIYVKELSKEETDVFYKEWKAEIVKQAKSEQIVEFTKKVFAIIESYR